MLKSTNDPTEVPLQREEAKVFTRIVAFARRHNLLRPDFIVNAFLVLGGVVTMVIAMWHVGGPLLALLSVVLLAVFVAGVLGLAHYVARGFGRRSSGRLLRGAQSLRQSSLEYEAAVNRLRVTLGIDYEKKEGDKPTT